MRLRSLAFAPILASLASLAALHCGGSAVGQSTLDGGPDGGSDGPGTTDAEGKRPNPDAVGATTSSKVDLLLVVDNSASMGDKAKLLSASVGTLLKRVVTAGDVHVGVITTSAPYAFKRATFSLDILSGRTKMHR